MNINVVEFVFPLTAVTVRAVKGDDGEPWFAAQDVCEALGLKNTSVALRNLDADEKGLNIFSTLGGLQELRTINESGLYALVCRSRRPEAKAFRKWVTSSVLPSIRKHGVYVAGQEGVCETEAFKTAARNLVDVVHREMFKAIDRDTDKLAMGLKLTPETAARCAEARAQQIGPQFGITPGDALTIYRSKTTTTPLFGG